MGEGTGGERDGGRGVIVMFGVHMTAYNDRNSSRLKPHVRYFVDFQVTMR